MSWAVKEREAEGKPEVHCGGPADSTELRFPPGGALSAMQFTPGPDD